MEGDDIGDQPVNYVINPTHKDDHPFACDSRRTILKRLRSIFLLALAAFLFCTATPLFAGDAEKGGKIFNANCASCHAGGNNLVTSSKSLKKDVLEKNGMYSAEAIIAQVTKGKNAMPAFKGRLMPNQIDDVATYVLSQAEKGWK